MYGWRFSPWRKKCWCQQRKILWKSNRILYETIQIFGLWNQPLQCAKWFPERYWIYHFIKRKAWLLCHAFLVQNYTEMCFAQKTTIISSWNICNDFQDSRLIFRTQHILAFYRIPLPENQMYPNELILLRLI